jgi:hypothetical protein
VADSGNSANDNSNQLANDIDITIGDGEMPWSDDDVVDIDLMKGASMNDVITAGW